MIKFRPQQTCVGCHFFVKHDRDGNRTLTFDVNIEEREQSKKGDFSWMKKYDSLACEFGVWDEGYKLDKTKWEEILLKTNRHNYCFYWPYRFGMMLPAAKILQEIEAKDRDATRDRRLTIVGLWIAALALVVNLILKLIGK